MVSLICTLEDHRDDVNWCAFSPTCLATCSLDKTIRLYSTDDFSELPFSPLNGHGYAVHCCCFSASGELLASCSTDGTTVLWSMDTGEIVAVLEHHGRSPVRICTFSPNSSYLVSGASDGTVMLWDVESKTLRRSGSVKDSSVVACSFSPCGQMFVTGSTYGDIRVWDLEMNHLLAVKNAHDLGVTCCHFSPQPVNDSLPVQSRLASCGQDNMLKIWTVTLHGESGCKLELMYTLRGQSAPVLSCMFSSDGQLLASGSVDKTVTIYDANQGILLYTLTQHERYVTACAFAPNLPLIATGSMDKTVNVWRVEDGASPCGKQGKSLPVEPMSHSHVESVGLRNKVIRKIEELKMESVAGIPDEFLCPITREVMRDPVIASDGYSYEREAIESWISTKKRSSPMTNLPLKSTVMTPNRTLKMAISRWRSSK
ncbi:WD repeat, SAM and U-box domain-containing protein 1 isoform X2 [Lepisosteus oculatus]|uniref:WD repeat, SAM and U-box domain-containing protein 1 isoform X2 n=1 Tax=Lepisosteus oculatus TaxID=7918 RepID=UPI0035F503A2